MNPTSTVEPQLSQMTECSHSLACTYGYAVLSAYSVHVVRACSIVQTLGDGLLLQRNALTALFTSPLWNVIAHH
jgi:hypothetical protein